MSFRAEGLLAGVLLLASGLALAAPPAPPAATAARADQTREQLTKLPSAASLRPTGPVNITARRAELVQGDSAIYTGNVVLDSNTLKMDGDRLELKQHASGQYEAKITGTPGHLSHNGTGGDDPSVSAHARTLIYNSETGVVDLLGDAFFKRGDDQISGDEIHYNLTERRIQATGGEAGQVHIILQPPPPEGGAPAPASPAPGAAPPASTAPSSTPPASLPARP